ncbi:hypothetical protein ACWGB8_33380 [Kitasatospora sp. NPDC054939]
MAALATTRDPGARGRLRIADRVYAAIAVRAARDALADAWRGHPGTAAVPHVSVSTPGTTVAVRVSVDLPFPIDLAAVAGTVRDGIAERLTTLTGTRVTGVTVVVDRLVPYPGGAAGA